MFIEHSRHRGVAQPGSALAWGASGRRFKSGRPERILDVLSSKLKNRKVVWKKFG